MVLTLTGSCCVGALMFDLSMEHIEREIFPVNHMSAVNESAQRLQCGVDTDLSVHRASACNIGQPVKEHQSIDSLLQRRSISWLR